MDHSLYRCEMMLMVLVHVVLVVCLQEAHLLKTPSSLSASPFLASKPSTTMGHKNASKVALPVLHGLYQGDLEEDDNHYHGAGHAPVFLQTSLESYVSGYVGTTVFLPCTVDNLGHKLVSWLKKCEDSLHLLTLGHSSYTSDTRISLEFVYPNQWRLRINLLSFNDSGVYICHVATEPPSTTEVRLNVSDEFPDPVVILVDAKNNLSEDQYYTTGSAVELKCYVNQTYNRPLRITWFLGAKSLHFDSRRGGYSIRTQFNESDAFSVLNVAKLAPSDSGIYKCSVDDYVTANITVHVLNEENPAAMQHPTLPVSSRSSLPHTQCLVLFVMIALVLLHIFQCPCT